MKKLHRFLSEWYQQTANIVRLKNLRNTKITSKKIKTLLI
jgi:hypothetical protein